MPEPAPIPRDDPSPLRRRGLRERVSAEILVAAASVLASSEGQASMSDVATAAGVARGTLYRYFPTRGSLLEQLRSNAIEDMASRLRASRIGEVAPLDGLERVIRAFVDGGDLFVVGARERRTTAGPDFEASVMLPLRELIERGQETGAIRRDIEASWLSECLLGLALVGASAGRLGTEDTVAWIKRLFLDGARVQ
jgi:TetR/AcrR family transcriptional regulator, mexCD-oprJ operon repressor